MRRGVDGKGTRPVLLRVRPHTRLQFFQGRSEDVAGDQGVAADPRVRDEEVEAGFARGDVGGEFGDGDLGGDVTGVAYRAAGDCCGCAQGRAGGGEGVELGDFLIDGLAGEGDEVDFCAVED